MKKYIAAAAIAAGYIVLCRLTRGYWNLGGDVIVIAMVAIAWAVLRVGLKRDSGSREAEEPTPIRVAKASGGIRQSERCAK